MNVECPECRAALEGSAGQEMVCPACMTPFVVPTQSRAVRAFDVQLPDGTILPTLGRHAIREAIYAGRVGSAARVRHDGGKWELIGGFPEFAAVFRLLGEDLAPLAGTRKLAGWKSTGDAETTEPPRFTTDLPHFLTEPRTGPTRTRPVDAPTPTLPPPERADEPPRPRTPVEAAPTPPRPPMPPSEPTPEGVPAWAFMLGGGLAAAVAAAAWFLG